MRVAAFCISCLRSLDSASNNPTGLVWIPDLECRLSGLDRGLVTGHEVKDGRCTT
ncbi:MAG: hypothetical protein ACI841_004610 [Planctomycetota bacterium]|jgi:hypothetical protein